MERVLMSWSGGKDSAMALREILRTPGFEVVALLTTVTEDYDRVSMHGVRRSLLRKQADSVGLRLVEVKITRSATNEEYEAVMKETLCRYGQDGVRSVVFGDIFLEDLRKYREGRLAQVGMTALFPIWRRNTKELFRSFVGAGFRAVTTCVDTQVLEKGFVGRELDEEFLARLPTGVDPCGENGEFHSFVYSGPILRDRIEIRTGKKVLREGRFYFCDLMEV